MSNRILAYILIIIVVAGAAVFVVWRLNARKANQLFAGQKEETNQVSAPAPENPPAKPNQPASEVLNGCERKFDAEKLKTAKVDIKNRGVEIDVKGFGKISVDFFDADAPKTVENFLRLANAGYFDCLTFHRVAKGFVIQGGDPTGIGSGGDSAFGGEFADEINPSSQLYKDGYKKGILAMANRGPNTNTSQFFIMLADVSLPASYTIFGKVTAGQDVADKIGQVEITPQLGPTDGAPKQLVVMESVRIIK